MNLSVFKSGLRFLGCFFGTVLVLILVAQASTAATVSQGYQSNDILVTGNIVSTNSNANNYQVQLATTDNFNNLLGIVVTPNSTLLSIDNTSSSAQVASSGVANGFVSDINGNISKGDAVAISPIAGVGMKATQPTRIVGVAQADFKSATNVQSKNLVDKQGQSKQVRVGLIPVLVNVGDYQPSNYSGNSAVVRGVQSAVSNLAGRSVSATRAMAAFGVITLAIILAIIVLYASVTGSIRSIGRNPLAKKSVLRSLAQVIVAVGLIIVAAIAAVYVIVIA
ncbi:hypothetical protein HYX70_03575 [Candidatus Saccharibacteria bacterium]|nr:hypothetical protein [Candidatus Saccharibacteria bacterium]